MYKHATQPQIFGGNKKINVDSLHPLHSILREEVTF